MKTRLSALAFAVLITTVTLARGAAAGREVLSFNQGWRFYRPTPATQPASYEPPVLSLVKEGVFPKSVDPQDVDTGPHMSRYVCLQSLSDHNGTPFASVAEFYLLGEKHELLPRTDWKIAYTDSEDQAAGDFAANAIDGNPATKWHSQWQGAQPAHPHVLVIDLGKPTSFTGFRCLPRPDGNSSGMIKGWKFYAIDKLPPQVGVADIEAEERGLDDAGWESVNLPHTVRLEPYDAGGGRNYQGICWYRRHFSAPESWKGRKILLEFEGAMQVADVWLNGTKLTTHYGGYQPFTIDLTETVRLGEDNVLTVRLDNRDNSDVPPGKPQNTLDFVYFGGLYRDVRLEVLDPLHITNAILANKPARGGIFVTFPKVADDAATVRVQADVTNQHASSKSTTVANALLDAAGNVVATGSTDATLDAGASSTIVQALEVRQPKLWHPDHPYLYTLKTTVVSGGNVVDSVETRVGIRTFRFDAKTGLSINGHKFVSLGCNRHQDHPYVGNALGANAQWRDAKKIHDAGFTSIRSHYPQDPAFVDACDELGILLIVSNPGWQHTGGALFTSRVYQDAREMVRRDRNHPSVILWEAQLNESDNKPLFPALQKIVHEEFPFEPCYTAGDTVGAPNWDVVYGGNDGSKPFWIRELGDQVDNWSDQQSAVRIARDWGETAQLVQAWSHVGSFDYAYGTFSNPAAGNESLCGVDLWAGVDAYRGYHHQPFLGGPIDLFRLPKFDYYFFQSQRPPDESAGARGGPMVFIANYATFQSPTVVTVFSNCQQVRLIQNGKEVAVQKPAEGHHVPHPPFSFRAGQFSGQESTLFMTGVARPGTAVGELKAEGLIDGKVVATHIVRPPGVPSAITLEADLQGRDLAADGADRVRVYARVCDSRGTVHPYANDEITFAVEGDGELIDDARIHANPIRAEAGIATILVRSHRKAGKITVRASAFGLKAAEVQIESKPPALAAAPAEARPG